MPRKKQTESKNSEIETLKKEGKVLLISRIINLRRVNDEQRDQIADHEKSLKDRIIQLESSAHEADEALKNSQNEVIGLTEIIESKREIIKSLQSSIDELEKAKYELEKKLTEMEIGKKMREQDLTNLRRDICRLEIQRDLLREIIFDAIKTD